MNKEMMDKVNEALKACGKRELSLDDLDKVNGGATGAWINGVFMSEDELHDIAYYWVDQFGYETAAVMFCELIGMDKYEIKRTHDSGETELVNMGFLVYRYMQIQDNLEEKGHSF